MSGSSLHAAHRLRQLEDTDQALSAGLIETENDDAWVTHWNTRVMKS